MAIKDNYPSIGESDSIRGGFAVAPSDSTDLAELPRAIWVGTGGALAMVMPSGQTITLTNVPDGCLLPFRPERVKSTGTTCLNIVACI